MWAIVNRTNYGVERNWIRDKVGVHCWVVAVRASYSIEPSGSMRPAEEQPSPALMPEYHGAPGASSLRTDSDLLYAKPCTDVIVEACAYAPARAKAESVVVSLRVGTLYKALVVRGERTYTRSHSPTRAQPFERKPIRYEQAYGGSDTTDRDPRKHRIYALNPVGVGFATDRAHLIDKPAPEIEYANGDIVKSGPAGFGPIDTSWSPRRELAGTYDAAWEANKKPLLADDYQELYGSCAPSDQRMLQYSRGGERVELVNMTPSRSLCFELPAVQLRFVSCFGSLRKEHAGHLTTVLIDLERMHLSLVWQSVLPVAAKHAEYLDQTIVTEGSFLS